MLERQDQRLSTIFRVRLTERERRMVDAVAQAEQLTPSALVRGLIRAELHSKAQQERQAERG